MPAGEELARCLRPFRLQLLISSNERAAYVRFGFLNSDNSDVLQCDSDRLKLCYVASNWPGAFVLVELYMNALQSHWSVGCFFVLVKIGVVWRLNCI